MSHVDSLSLTGGRKINKYLGPVDSSSSCRRCCSSCSPACNFSSSPLSSAPRPMEVAAVIFSRNRCTFSNFARRPSDGGSPGLTLNLRHLFPPLLFTRVGTEAAAASSRSVASLSEPFRSGNHCSHVLCDCETQHWLWSRPSPYMETGAEE